MPNFCHGQQFSFMLLITHRHTEEVKALPAVMAVVSLSARVFNRRLSKYWQHRPRR